MAYSPPYPIINPCAEIFLQMPTYREFVVIDKDAIVDGEKWYTVVAELESSAWLRQQHKSQWFETSGSAFSSSVFDIHNELLFLMKLKWAS